MSAPPLSINTDTRAAGDGVVATVRVSGEIDLANADRLASALLSPDCVDASAVVLDLTEVSFIDSSGLAALLTGRKALDSRLAVVLDEGSPVTRLFEIAGLESHLRTASSESAALAALGVADPDGGD